MGSPEAVSERTREELHNQIIWDGGDQQNWVAGAYDPVHFGSLALLCNNSDPDVPATIRIWDSMDGVVWTILTFSTGFQGSLLQFTICPLGQRQFLFESNRRYIRITTTPFNPAGIQIIAQQHVPRSRIRGADIYG